MMYQCQNRTNNNITQPAFRAPRGRGCITVAYSYMVQTARKDTWVNGDHEDDDDAAAAAASDNDDDDDDGGDDGDGNEKGSHDDGNEDNGDANDERHTMRSKHNIRSPCRFPQQPCWRASGVLTRRHSLCALPTPRPPPPRRPSAPRTHSHCPRGPRPPSRQRPLMQVRCCLLGHDN